MSKIDSERDIKIVKMFRSGAKLQEIADNLGVSKQRVGQITKRNGLTFSDGGAHRSSKAKNLLENKSRDARYIKKYGCNFSVFKGANKNKDDRGKTPLNRFIAQRCNAKLRKIEWRLSFYDWWSIWCDSGKWGKRGRHYGQYVMGRKYDKGPYSVENVEIITCSENVSNGYAYMKKAVELTNNRL